MSSTTLAKLSLTVQPENAIGQQDIQNTANVGYQKIDIDLIKHNTASSPDKVGSQANGITHDNASISNVIGEKQQTDKTKTVTQSVDLLPKETHPENEIEERTWKETPSKLTNGGNETEDQFQRLPKPQQDILLLHGPGQRYRLERAHDIPELQSDQEILVQVGEDIGRMDLFANTHRWLRLG